MGNTMLSSTDTGCRMEVTPWPDGTQDIKEAPKKQTKKEAPMHHALKSPTATVVKAIKGKSRVLGCERNLKVKGHRDLCFKSIAGHVLSFGGKSFHTEGQNSLGRKPVSRGEVRLSLSSLLDHIPSHWQRNNL